MNDQLTPAGRVPNAPLSNRKHEQVAHELAVGKSTREACLAAGALNPAGRSFAPNARRLCQRTDIRERVAELAAQGAELAGIHAGWVLEALSKQARASLAAFMARDEHGNIIKNSRGDPLYDFSQASDDDLRTIKEIKMTKWGPQPVLHDPQVALDRLGRYLGLWSGDAVAVASAEASSEHSGYIISDRPMTEEEWEKTRASAPLDEKKEII